MDWMIDVSDDSGILGNERTYCRIVRVSTKEDGYVLEDDPIIDSIQIGLVYGDLKRILKVIEKDQLNWDCENNKIIFPILTENEKSSCPEWIIKYEFEASDDFKINGMSDSQDNIPESKISKTINYDYKIEELGWMPIDERIGLAAWYEYGTDYIRTRAYLHCFHKDSNKNFVVIANNGCYDLDKKSLTNPDNWNLDEDSEGYSSLFKESEILEWKTTDEKIGGILFVYNDLDGLYIQDTFPGDYGWPEVGDKSRTVCCSKDNVNQKIEDFISSGEYLNYQDILIASDDISHELADKIDGLNYDGFVLFGNSPESEWLKQYKWCIFDPDKSKSLMYDNYVEDHYGWGTDEGIAVLDAINAIVTGHLDGRGEYSNNLKVMNALYEKWGAGKFLGYIFRYCDGCDEIELDEVTYDDIVEECKRLYDVKEIDDYDHISTEEERRIEKERINSAKQKLNEALENKKADFTKEDITVCLYALDLMKETFYEAGLFEDIESVEYDLFEAGVIE